MAMQPAPVAGNAAAASSGLDTDTFLVREHVGMFKLHEAYDLLTQTGQPIGTAIERASGWKKLLKLFVNKNMLPFTVEILDTQQRVLITIRRPFTIFRSRVSVFDAGGANLGYFQQRLLSLGGKFDIFDPSGQQLAQLAGDWKGWNFKFTNMQGDSIGMVSRQWGGVAKELFTNADNYVVHIDRTKVTSAQQLELLLASAICIDMVLKEAQG